MNLVEKATKVMGFKASIVSECKKRNMRVPTDEQISAYINSGRPMTLDALMYDYTHFEGVFTLPNREPTPLEEATLKATLEQLDEAQLKVLWGVFIQEIGNDCGGYIYDLADDNERQYLLDRLSQETLSEIGGLVIREDARFIRIVDDKPQVVDIEQEIEVHWHEIFERVMLFPYCYEYDYEEGSGFFTNIIAPIMIKMLGYDTDYQTCEVKYKGEK